MLYLNDTFPQRGSIKRVQDVCAENAFLKGRCSISTQGLDSGDKHQSDPSTLTSFNNLEADWMEVYHLSVLSGALYFDPNMKSMG